MLTNTSVLTIRCPQGFQSFAPFEPIELPDFVVVTGLNASGKTQLLSGIENGSVQIEREGVEIAQRHYFGSLYPTIEDRLQTKSYLPTLTNFGDNVAGILQGKEQRQEHFDILCEIANKLGLDPTRLDSRHLRAFGLPYEIASRRFLDGPFELRLATALRSRQLEIDYHVYNRYLAQAGQPTMSTPLTDIEFEERYGTPLEAFFDEAIAPLGYALAGEGLHQAEVSADMNLRLRHLERGHEVAFSGLSSGEKAVLSLLIHTIIHGEPTDAETSAVMLLDEADSALHPQLMRKFIDDVREMLVERGTAVILATHSPSMVALAPDESLYAMHAQGEPRLRKVTKDHALGMLTEGVPSLRIDYRHCRQVFVEAELDAELYAGVYQLLRRRLDPEIALSFVAAGKKKRNPVNDAPQGDEGGGCSAVRRLVKDLRGGGNDRVFGIIDRDQGATEGGGVFVVGGGQAYAIENVLLDPLLVGALAAREGALSKTELEDVTFLEICKGDSPLLSRVATFVCARLSREGDEPVEQVTRTYATDGVAIVCPRWYLEMRGHDLAERVLDSF